MRFDVQVAPGYVDKLEVGDEITLTIDNHTINATIVDIRDNWVTHEVLGDDESIIKPYFEPSPISFSISSKGVI